MGAANEDARSIRYSLFASGANSEWGVANEDARSIRHSLLATRYRSPLTFGERAPTVCRYPVSGTVSLPSSGCFSLFPHGTCSLSVAEEYLGLEGGPPAFRQDCTCPALLESFARTYPYGAVTRCGPAFQPVLIILSQSIGLIRVRSPLLTESR